MKTISIAIACAALLLSTRASADVSFTPSAQVRGTATDNAGNRPVEMGPREDLTTTVSAGGRLVMSRPLWSIKADALGEYERYLSAGVRNTYASGGLDGKWRPSERSFIRSQWRASYAPDRWDPRVPYRLALAAAPGEEVPPFVRATTAKWSGMLLGERRPTELTRVRGMAQVTDTRYSDRRLLGGEAIRADTRILESRTAYESEGTWLRNVTETFELGAFGGLTAADYAIGPTAYAAKTGVAAEWRIVERVDFVAHAGPSYVTVPGTHLPDRIGWNADAALVRTWLRGSLELGAKEGVALAHATMPASHRREGRITGRFAPFSEAVSTEAWVAAGRERSLYSAYRATGTATYVGVGGALGWRMTEVLTAKAGVQHERLTTTGRVDLPFESNFFFLGITFTGRPMGNPPAPEANP